MNWLQKESTDFTYGVNNVKDTIIESVQKSEQAKDSAASARTYLMGMIANLTSAIQNDQIENISVEQKTDLISQKDAMDEFKILCDVFEAGCEVYKSKLNGTFEA